MDPCGVKRLQPVKRRRFRTKSDVKPLFDVIATDAILSKELSNMTLLEKAHVFRTKFPEKFQARQQEIDRRDKECVGVYEMTPFLTEYYRRIRQTRQEYVKMEQEEKAKPRTITVEISFTQDAEKTAKKLDKIPSPSKPGHQRNSSTGGISLSLPRKNSLGSMELTVKVVSGDCLFNGLDSNDERYKTCWVNVAILPDGKASSSLRKTAKSPVTCFGQANWDTKLSFKGYTTEQLEGKYLKFVVIGKTRNDKQCIGHAIMSGNKASIDVEGCHPRKPRKEEAEHFMAAINKPGSTYSAKLSLIRQGAAGLRAEDVSFSSQSDIPSLEPNQDAEEEPVVQPERIRKNNRTTIRRKNFNKFAAENKDKAGVEVITPKEVAPEIKPEIKSEENEEKK